MENKGVNRPLLIGAVIFTFLMVVFGLFFCVHASTIPQDTEKVITLEFAEHYVKKEVYKDIGMSMLGGAVFGGGLIILALLWNYSRSTVMKYLATAMMLFCAIFPLGVTCSNSVPMLTNKPRVETVQVVSRFEKHGGRTTHYKFRFSNGASGNVSYGEYKNVPDGSKYHVIMCGNYCAGTFNADHYVDLS